MLTRRLASLVGTVLLGAALGGCAGEASSSLCPSCQPAPPESAASISVVDCQYRTAAVTDAQRTQWQLDALVARLMAFESELQWERPATDDREPQLLQRTTLDAEIRLGAFSFVQSEPCGSNAVAPATATWSTRDGALRVETDGELRLDVRDLSWRLEATASLETATGTLEVPVDRARKHRGTLSALAEPSRAIPIPGPDRPAGYIAANVEYSDSVDGAWNTTRVDTPIGGAFPPRSPSAHCLPGQTSIPNAPDDPCPQFGTDCARAGDLAVATCEENDRYGVVCKCIEP